MPQPRSAILFFFSGLLSVVFTLSARAGEPAAALPWPVERFTVAEKPAFLVAAARSPADAARPWVWYAPTLPDLPGRAEEWLFERLRGAGIAIAGVNVGESYGNLAGRAVYTALHAELVRRGYTERPVLLGRSRGGLMLLSWAADHPQAVAGFAGIYPVCNLASYPGLATASGAYGLTPEELGRRFAEFNPIERLGSLVAAHVPLFVIHGDSDKLVPLEQNSGVVRIRYEALGGSIRLIVPAGQGHSMWPGFFQNDEMAAWMIATAQAAAKN
jgi:pimeloyl-ACP methyl ester carboxylesterase